MDDGAWYTRDLNGLAATARLAGLIFGPRILAGAMAKKRAKKQEPGKVPPPYPLAMVVCDNIHRDPGTGKVFLLGSFSTIHATNFPARHALMGLYVELTNGRGKVPVRIRLIDANEEREPLWEEINEFEFPDPRMVLQIVSYLAGITFPEPGEYRFQVFASGEFLMERRLLVIQQLQRNPNE